MAKDKKFVKEITSMEEDFAQWYTDVVKKSGADRLHQCKRLYGDQTGRICDLGKISSMSWTEGLKRPVWRMFIFPCLFRKAFFRRKRIMWRGLPPEVAWVTYGGLEPPSGETLRTSHFGNAVL